MAKILRQHFPTLIKATPPIHLLNGGAGVFNAVGDCAALMHGPDMKTLRAKIGQQALENDLLEHALSIEQQCRLDALAPSTCHYRLQLASEDDIEVMQRVDELHLEMPFVGARMLRDTPRQEGYAIGRKHVTTLMRRMELEALYRKPNPRKKHPRQKIYP